MYSSVLITGGTGTFGTSYICKAIENRWHSKIIVYSRDEFKQVRLSKYIQSKYSNRVISSRDFAIALDTCEIRFFIGDVQDFERLKIAMKDVDLVVHSAALKHVPVCEYNPEQAINTNITGSINVAKAAALSGVKKVVGLSTDKAADPINLYGASKLCLEKILLGYYNYFDTTTYHIVRYGNVIGSRGSIIPMISDPENFNLKITDPEMTRFWISIEDAIALTRYAIREGTCSEIFVPKMKSLSMEKVFEYLRPDTVPEHIGRRPGEKQHETMISENDMHRTFDLGECYGIQSDLHSSRIFDNKKPVSFDVYTSDTVDRFTKEEFLKKVQNTMVVNLNNELLK
mgnify:CR=1 FL=1